MTDHDKLFNIALEQMKESQQNTLELRLHELLEISPIKMKSEQLSEVIALLHGKITTTTTFSAEWVKYSDLFALFSHIQNTSKTYLACQEFIEKFNIPFHPHELERNDAVLAVLSAFEKQLT